MLRSVVPLLLHRVRASTVIASRRHWLRLVVPAFRRDFSALPRQWTFSWR